MSKDFSGKKLMGVNFSGQDLEDADFSSASIMTCSFLGANLANANFEGAKCNACDFSKANLTDAQFSDAKIIGSSFVGAVLDGCNLEEATLTACNISAPMMAVDAQGYEDEADEAVDQAESDEDSDEDSDDETEEDLHEIVDCEWVKVLATDTPWSKKSHLEVYEIREYNVSVSSIELHFHVCLVHLEQLPGSQVLVRLREISDDSVEISEWTLDSGESMTWECPQIDGWTLSVEAPERQN